MNDMKWIKICPMCVESSDNLELRHFFTTEGEKLSVEVCPPCRAEYDRMDGYDGEDK